MASKSPKITPPSVPAPSAEDPTTAITSLIKKARANDFARRAAAPVSGTTAYQQQEKTLLGTPLR